MLPLNNTLGGGGGCEEFRVVVVGAVDEYSETCLERFLVNCLSFLPLCPLGLVGPASGPSCSFAWV